MITEDQTAVIDFLASPATHGGARVERIDTHTAVVFLAGTRAWKLKRAVRYDYLDFSTADRRRVVCQAEVRINRRVAPTLYRGVTAVTHEADGSLALGGSGEPVEWLVEMNRFDQEALFDRLAARSALGLELMRPLAEAIAQFHAGAERRADHGGEAGMVWVVEGNAAGFAEFATRVLDSAACFRVTDAALAAIERNRTLLELRRAGGLVRQCHGDLHLRNIVLLDGRPTLFDAIEFNDEIACTDVLYDLAFLLMDLWRRELPRHANTVWNAYLSETGDLDGGRLLPLFLSCRAAVRAKTSATAARLQADPGRRSELDTMAREYLAMAEQLLHPAPSHASIAIGGFSGSGKSTLAMALAPAVGTVPGAVVLRSDEIRKKLCGVQPLDRLGPDSYTPTCTQRVYAVLADQADAVVHAGHVAIVDAVYREAGGSRPHRPDRRQRLVPFVGLWLDAPEPVLISRSNAAAAIRRMRTPTSSDCSLLRIRARFTGTVSMPRRRPVSCCTTRRSPCRTIYGLPARLPRLHDSLGLRRFTMIAEDDSKELHVFLPLPSTRIPSCAA